MKQILVKGMALFLALLMLASLVAGCAGGDRTADTEGDTLTDTQATVDASTDGETEASADVTDPADDETRADVTADTEAATEAVTEAETEDPATRINKPTDAAHVTFYNSTRPRLNTVISGANECDFEIVMDKTYGSVLKLTTKANASDPYVHFNYSAYLQPHKLTPVSADEYK